MTEGERVCTRILLIDLIYDKFPLKIDPSKFDQSPFCSNRLQGKNTQRIASCICLFFSSVRLLPNIEFDLRLRQSSRTAEKCDGCFLIERIFCLRYGSPRRDNLLRPSYVICICRLISFVFF